MEPQNMVLIFNENYRENRMKKTISLKNELNYSLCEKSLLFYFLYKVSK